MLKAKALSIITVFCLLASSISPIRINATEKKDLVFLGDTYSESDVNNVIAQYDEFANIDIKVGYVTDEIKSNSSYAVDLIELQHNTELAKFINNCIENNIVYFLGKGTVKDVENALGVEIELTAPIYDIETNMPNGKNAKYDNNNPFSVFGYTKNENTPGFGERVIINSNSKSALILTAIRQFKDNQLTPKPRYSIRKSGSGGKLYTNIEKDIYTKSTWILYDIPYTDTTRRYYATKVNIWFNKDGKQAVVKQYGSPPYDPISIGVAPTNKSASTEWTASIPAGISVSYSGTKVKVSLSRPDSLTNVWTFADGTLFANAFFDSGDDFECITEWSISTKYKGALFFYDESGYDMYAGHSAPTMTGISI